MADKQDLPIHFRSANDMSLLDWFAGQALACSATISADANDIHLGLAKECYDLATAMLKESAKRRESC